MKRTFTSLVAIMIVAGLLLAACASPGPAPAPQPAPTPAPKPAPAPAPAPKPAPAPAPAPAPKPAPAAKPIVWDYAHFLSPSSGSSQAAIYLGDALAKRTGGRFTVKYHWSGSLLDEQTMAEGIKMGLADMGSVSSGRSGIPFYFVDLLNLPMIVPVSTPEGIRTQALRVVSDYHAHPAVQAEFLNANMEPGVSIPVVMDPINFVSKKPVNTIEDLKGVKMRSPNPVMGTMFAKLGMVPVVTSYGEVYSALQTGLIGAAPTYYAYIDSEKYYEVVDYLTTGINIMQNLGMFVGVNRDSYNALPPDMKAIFKEEVQNAAIAGANWVIDRVTPGIEKSEKVFKVTYLSQAEVDKIKVVAGKPLWNEYAGDLNKKGLPGTTMLDFLLSLGDKYAK